MGLPIVQIGSREWPVLNLAVSPLLEGKRLGDRLLRLEVSSEAAAVPLLSPQLEWCCMGQFHLLVPQLHIHDVLRPPPGLVEADMVVVVVGVLC